ncbi:MAG: hypothetical protein OEV01_00885 [Nitrospira sp.]|nr:hypothetical protein [Nitrospira sp.]MDH4302870.1 hypothetical protein [Nitrospira sp.]MDH5192192.1 hypothetical protein [Nitrospira sp.]
MTPVQGAVRHPQLQSVGDLARAQVIVEALGTPRENTDRKPVRQEARQRLEELGDHPLSPAMGIVNGLRLSLVLWGFILLGVVLIW